MTREMRGRMKREKIYVYLWLSEETLQTAMKRRDVKIKGAKERYSHLNAEFQRER